MSAPSRYRLALTLIAITATVSAIPARAQEKSEAQQAWEQQVGERQLENPAYAYVEDDPALPRVLLIGDSISIGYTAGVREALKGKANVHRIPANGGDTNRGLASIDNWLGGGHWDVIHFNWGLHDLKRVKDGKLDASVEKAVSPEDYEKNLRALVQRLQKTGAKLIWAATTPVPEGAAGRIADEVELYNAIAAGIMAEMEVAVDDLYNYVQPHLATYQRSANVHYTPEGYAYLGKRVAEAVLEALGAKP